MQEEYPKSGNGTQACQSGNFGLSSSWLSHRKALVGLPIYRHVLGRGLIGASFRARVSVLFPRIFQPGFAHLLQLRYEIAYHSLGEFYGLWVSSTVSG